MSVLRHSSGTGDLQRSIGAVVESLRRPFSGVMAFTVRGRAAVVDTALESCIAVKARVLEDALHSFDDRDVTVTGAGRTDAGVHALGQVSAVSLQKTIDAETLARALNAKLPETIRVQSACEVP